MSSVNLRRPLMPIKLHAKLMTLAVKVRRVAAQEEQDRGRRQAMAEAALRADGVPSALPRNPEACWYLDYHQPWLVRLQCRYGRATGFALRAAPDASAANAARARPLPAPSQSHWRGNESAVVRGLRVRTPAEQISQKQ